ncbi:hypothetical protein TRFO_21870 [Tritrichomonas foetus]|uniref:UDENN domain-containing protein n=1 Tax=Tritrichomonas foetus TaxID=1144522 RepID=A0A1J4KJ04_9EUKA|nr:hypothetical protein TRFO_21870 [Tritrichomonas foetus]|eukprot:OHT09301.1 hypothetical protein TRFO_21870 [Tritrichomonas foetus]
MLKFQTAPDDPPYNYICRAYHKPDQTCEIDDIFLLGPEYKEKYISSLPRFLFPYSSNQIQSDTNFSFCLTDTDKNPSYVFAYTSYSKVKDIYYVYAIISEYFHPEFLKEVIFNVALTYETNSSFCQSYTEYFSKISLTQTPFDWFYNESNRIYSASNNHAKLLEHYRFLSPMNEIGSLLKYMVSNFSAHYLLSMIVSMMNDYRIIILSASPENLGMTSYGLLSLIYPIKWSGSFIPILPNNLDAYLDSPIAYIDGVHSSFADVLLRKGMGSYFVINADLHDASLVETEDFPADIQNVIDPTAEKIKEVSRSYNKIFPAAKIRHILLKFVAKIYGTLYQVNWKSPNDVYEQYNFYRRDIGEEMRSTISQTQFTQQFFENTMEEGDDKIFKMYWPNEERPESSNNKLDKSEKVEIAGKHESKTSVRRATRHFIDIDKIEVSDMSDENYVSLSNDSSMICQENGQNPDLFQFDMGTEDD